MRSTPADQCVLGCNCPTFGELAGRRLARDLGPEDARADAQERRRLLHDLRHALAVGGFALHYQPRVALADGAVAGAEGLLRWPHRRHGLVSPERFVPLLEQAGLIGPVGIWALRTACAEAASWPDKELTLSLNISPRQLQDAAFLSHVAMATQDAGLAPERLELELAEATLLAMDDDALFLLSALRDLGVGLALDDFGTGLASLSMIRRLPLTTLKLDRSLVRELPANAEDSAIVHAVVSAAHAMGLAVTAEGVETEAQRDFLAIIGTDHAQGFLFGRTLHGTPTRERDRG